MDFAQSGNKVDVHQRSGTCHAHFHQRDQALPPGDDPSFFPQFLKKLDRFLQRCRAMIRKWRSVHVKSHSFLTAKSKRTVLVQCGKSVQALSF